MNSATQSVDADFFIVSEPFTRAAERPFLSPGTGARQGLPPEAPTASAGKLLMALLAACGIGSAPRITGAECVSSATAAQA
ncbi:MAG: hypothetical protein LBC14_01720 [Desulfovibrio sp.]|nr:hypothetical protein [Desulfovibrio sp.]